MPLGMLYTMSHLASLAGIAPELCIAAATGSNARVYGLDFGLLAAGKAADIVLLDAPDGGTQDNALAAIRNGDIAAVGAVITGGGRGSSAAAATPRQRRERSASQAASSRRISRAWRIRRARQHQRRGQQRQGPRLFNNAA